MARGATALLAVSLALAGGVLVGTASAAPAGSGSRALWVWTRPAPEELVGFARERGVQELLVAVPPSVDGSGDLPRLRRLAELAEAADLRLVALGGEPGWTFDHAAALDWQRSALATGLFAAVHVDVEPHQLPEWQDRRDGAITSYLSLLGKLQRASPLPLEAALPFWYGDIAAPPGAARALTPETLADAVLRRVDAVTVMSHRDTAGGTNGMLAVGADLLRRGAAAGKPVRLGAETNPLPGDEHTTFAQEGDAVLRGVLGEVDEGAAEYSSYAGVAVHDFDGWRALRP